MRKEILIFSDSLAVIVNRFLNYLWEGIDTPIELLENPTLELFNSTISDLHNPELDFQQFEAYHKLGDELFNEIFIDGYIRWLEQIGITDDIFYMKNPHVKVLTASGYVLLRIGADEDYAPLETYVVNNRKR